MEMIDLYQMERIEVYQIKNRNLSDREDRFLSIENIY